MGPLQINLRTACQRYRQTNIDAEKTTSVRETVANLLERSKFSLTPAASLTA